MSAEQPKVLTIFAADSIQTNDVPPGIPKQTPEQIEEKLPPEEIEKRQKIMLEYTRLLARYCPPHNKLSRWVNTDDIPRVLADGKDLMAMCNLPRGRYSSISALAHPQIDDKDPLRFFVLPSGMVVINPVITNHTKFFIDKKEGCMSYPDEEIKEVSRYNRATVVYQTLVQIDDKSEPILSKSVTENLSGGIAHIFQHECGHLNGCNIYDADYSPEKSIDFGDGIAVDPKIWDNENNK